MINKIRKLVNTVTELGGTPYEVAEAGGLLSAYRFLKLHLGEQEDMLPQNVKVVTEAYIFFEDTEELDRIFLYSDDLQSDEHLIKEGSIRDGRFVIDYHKLKNLATKGYQCLYHRSEDGHNGKAFVRYHAAFGYARTMLPFQTWDSDAFFVGNGFNQALFVTKEYGSLFVMPDIHAVQESIRVLHAENLIREKQDARFRIERILMEDEKVLEILKTARKDIIGQERTAYNELLPESYRKLYYQIAYIMTCYPEVYEMVWQNVCGTNNGKQQPLTDTKVTVGISLDYCKSFGVCMMPDGTIRRIPNVECPYEISNNLNYCFDGYGNIFDAGTSTAKLATIMKNIITSAALTYKVTVEKIYVTVVENADIDKKALIERAAHEKKLPKIEYVDYCTAIMKAYSKESNVKQMKENDVALLYDFSEVRMFLALIKKSSENTFKIVQKAEYMFPEDCIYEASEDFSCVYKDTFQEVCEDEFGEFMNPGLREVLWSDIEYFMLDAGLRVLGINNRKAADRKALEEVRRDWLRVKRQLMRNDSAKIIFDNGYLFMTEDYPIDRFEECFLPVLRKSDAAITELLMEAEIPMSALSAVLLAGEDSEYPFVQEHLKQFIGMEVNVINALECVAAKGAVLHKSEL